MEDRRDKGENVYIRYIREISRVTKKLKQKLNHNKGKTAICIYYQNVGGLRTKLNELHHTILGSSYSIIILVKSWRNKNFCSEELYIIVYNILMFDRECTDSNKKR